LGADFGEEIERRASDAKLILDSYSLYNENMSSYGIGRTGSSGSYTYSATSGFENKPVVYV